MVSYAVEHGASQATLHRAFYSEFREKYPWMPTRVVKARLRLAKLSNGLVLDRDVVGAVNIGLGYLSSDGSPVALGSTEPHEVRVKLVSPHQGLTPLRN